MCVALAARIGSLNNSAAGVITTPGNSAYKGCAEVNDHGFHIPKDHVQIQQEPELQLGSIFHHDL